MRLVWNEPCLSAEHPIIRELAATPISVLLVAGLRKNCPRNQPFRFGRQPEPTVGEDNLIVLPSSVCFQLFGKIQMLGDADYVRILVRPNLPVTRDGHDLAKYEEAKIFDWSKGTQVILNTGIVLKDFHSSLAHNYVRGLMNF